MSTKLSTIILVSGVIYGVLLFSADKLAGSETFFNKVEQTREGNDSNRSNLHTIQLNAFVDKGDLFTLLFGFGADGSIRISPNYAHNDWIEILVDQGIIGLFVFLYFWLIFYKTWRRSVKNPFVYNVIGMIFITAMIRTMFSMWYSNTNMFVSIPLGYCLAILQGGIKVSADKSVKIKKC